MLEFYLQVSEYTAITVGIWFTSICKRIISLHQSTAASTWWCEPQPRLGWVKWLWAFPRVPVTPGTPLHFFAMLPPERMQTAAHSFFKIGRLFSPFLFSCPSSSPHFSPSLDERKRLSQPWFHLFLLCVRWKCDLVGQVSAMMHMLQMGPSKVLTAFPLQIQSSWQLSILELPPCRNTVTPSSDPSDMYTSTVQSGPPSANAALLPHPRLQSSYPPSAHIISSSSAPSRPSLAPGCPSASPASSTPDSLRVLQWNAGGL